MRCLDVTVEIEHHKADENHQFHTRYSLEKYTAVAKQLELLIGERLARAGVRHSVAVNPEPGGAWKQYFFVPSYYTKGAGYDKTRKCYPRLGAFEVTLRCSQDFADERSLPRSVEVWSKLRTRRWPKAERLANDLANLLTAGGQCSETREILERINQKMEQAASLVCSPAGTATSMRLAKPPAGPIAVSLRGRDRPGSAPAGRGGPQVGPKRLKPLSEAPTPSSTRPSTPRSNQGDGARPPRGKPVSDVPTPSSTQPSTPGREVEGTRTLRSRPPTPLSGKAVSNDGQQARGPREAPPRNAAESVQLLEACQLAELLGDPAEGQQKHFDAEGVLEEQRKHADAEGTREEKPAAEQTLLVPAPASPSRRKPRNSAYEEEEEFEESEDEAVPSKHVQGKPHEDSVAVSMRLPDVRDPDATSGVPAQGLGAEEAVGARPDMNYAAAGVTDGAFKNTRRDDDDFEASLGSTPAGQLKCRLDAGTIADMSEHCKKAAPGASRNSSRASTKYVDPPTRLSVDNSYAIDFEDDLAEDGDEDPQGFSRPAAPRVETGSNVAGGTSGTSEAEGAHTQQAAADQGGDGTAVDLDLTNKAPGLQTQVQAEPPQQACAAGDDDYDQEFEGTRAEDGWDALDGALGGDRDGPREDARAEEPPALPQREEESRAAPERRPEGQPAPAAVEPPAEAGASESTPVDQGVEVQHSSLASSPRPAKPVIAGDYESDFEDD
mmetsp:Transcript_48666/g.139083  ORF Transcript_48666/g.139083 Transcript_48666/m.139083 type:complete len:722 (+) Transcript_48666:97-2262(+)